MAPVEKWGTISKCRFPLGYQRMTNFELQQSVEKLTQHRPKKVRAWWADEWKHKRGDEVTVNKIVAKLTNGASDKATDAQRISQGRILNMGVVNSYAWKGYN